MKADKFERETLREICERASAGRPAVVLSAINTDVLEAFEREDFTLDNAETWLAEKVKEKTHWFEHAPQIDREMIAFGQGNATERGRLFNELGPAAYAERCKAWGLKGPNDFRKGTPPDNGGDGDSKPKKKTPDASNPFSRAGWNITEQGRVMKTNPTLAENLAKAANVKIGATRPVM